MTAAHMLAPSLAFEQQRPAYTTYALKVAEINANPGMSENKKRKAIARLPVNKEWVKNQSNWWSSDTLILEEFAYNNLMDIAVGKLKNFQPDMVADYPLFRKVENEIVPGTSLCRLGFPFYDVATTYDEDTRRFVLAPGTLPVPLFPLDGIMTRTLVHEDPVENKEIKFIEMSTPGLRGQSGGPIFDVNGQICGLQTRTQHLSLGFDIKVREGFRTVTDRQYLHTGIGLHLDNILEFLNSQGVEYQTAP